MFGLNLPYSLIIGLQAICLFHCVRKGNQNKWIWIIIFLPLLGCIAYIFSEIFTRRDLNSVQSNFNTIIFPTGRIKDLEKKLTFSETFDNKVELANAHFANRTYDKAIELYESCLSGIFVNNELVISKLIEAYFETGKYEDVIKIAQRIIKSSEFAKSHAHVLYALSLENTGQMEQAENELKSIKGKYSNFEGRLNYGKFLVRAGRPDEAKEIFEEILLEASHMNSGESRNNKPWFKQTREERSKIS